MKKTQKTLMTVYIAIVVVTLLIVALCETGVFDSGQMAHNKQAEFIATTIMELVTLGSAFLALRMFKFKAIRQELLALQAPALLKFGLLRLMLLEAPMLLNTLFYYMFMNPTLGYMAIILLLCLPFVYPSMGRCIAETTEE